MRRGTDRGCVFLLDGRAREPKHRMFLAELPLGAEGAQLETGPTDGCFAAAFEHMGLAADLAGRGLDTPFARTLLDTADGEDWQPWRDS